MTLLAQDFSFKNNCIDYNILTTNYKQTCSTVYKINFTNFMIIYLQITLTQTTISSLPGTQAHPLSQVSAVLVPVY